jgi:6-pyruvoyltetrahydropterin/6-carboxytetrahydropterin synthase
MFEISVTAAFDASHFIEAPAGAPGYRRVHGHSFVVTACVAAAGPDADGWVMDLGKFEALLKEIIAPLDHSILNEIEGLEKPTFENILLWIERQMKARGVSPSRLEIERPTLRQRAVYTPR